MALPDGSDTALTSSINTHDSSMEAPPVPAENENPFSCNVCKRSYTRVDHLARHYRSHTREKPFTCDVCKKSFARVDLLKRHATSHIDENVNKRHKAAQRSSHSRASQACIACAESKLRCDGVNPCGRCQHKGIDCIYAQPRSRRPTSFASPQNGSQDSGTAASVSPIPAQGSAGVPSTKHQSPNMQPYYNQDPLLGTGTDPLTEAHVLMGTQMGNQMGGQMGGQMPDQGLLDPNQLPTPATFDQGSGMMPFGQSFYDGDPMMTFEDLPLLDFLRDVMSPTPAHATLRQTGTDPFPPFPRDVLDFNIDTSLDLPSTYSMPYLLPNEQTVPASTSLPVRIDLDDQGASKSGYTTPGVRRSISLGTQAFKDSIWLWTPAQEDHGNMEQFHLSLPDENVVLEKNAIDSSFAHGNVLQATRDRVLAMVLGTCEETIYPRVVACFPSAELLTNLVHNFISFHVCKDMTWIHPATLKINEEPAEFIGACACSGAAISRVPEIRKLGFALQEAVRLSMPKQFESDNRTTRQLRFLQSYALHLDVGLWSGNRRKMEISESFALPLITMVRRAGHFRRPRSTDSPPQIEDDEKTLETKWRNWVEAESFKRLGLYLFSRDTRTSISLLNQPLISYAEISADLPFTKDLWLARTATEWREIYLQRHTDVNARLPSIRTCVDDTSPVFKYQHIVDVRMTLMAILSSIWALIWQYREMKTTARFHAAAGVRNSAMTANSLQQEITQLMQHLGLNATEWEGGIKPGGQLLFDQCLMHLHVSLEDVQLLAGKEGEEEARRVFPILSAWADSSDSRQAIYHAGQVFRTAKIYEGFMLRDGSAVAVYHASLTLWAYSVLSKSLHMEEAQAQIPHRSVPGPNRKQRYVRLDDGDSPELQRFLVLGKGIPCIRRWVEGENSSEMHDVPLTDPMAVMNAITGLLWKKNGDDDRKCPPLVMNLSKLMRSLGGAAAGMRRK